MSTQRSTTDRAQPVTREQAQSKIVSSQTTTMIQKVMIMTVQEPTETALYLVISPSMLYKKSSYSWVIQSSKWHA